MSDISDLYRNRGVNPLAVQGGVMRLPLDANTVGLWQFDEKAGTTLLDKASTPHAITLNGPTWTTGGPWGSALSFDGSNDYGQSSGCPIYNATNSTIEVVCRSSIVSFAGGDFPLYSESKTDGPILVFERNNNKIVLSWDTVTYGWYVLSATNDITSWADWKYLVATNADKTGTLYANGVSVGTSNAAGLCGAINVVGADFCKFRSLSTLGTFEIAAIRLSTVARSAAEILTNAKLMGLA